MEQVYFTDWSQAQAYVQDLNDHCGGPVSESNDCWTRGNRWSLVYALCSMTMLFLAANAALMIFGTWSFFARGLSGCCGTLCCCLNFAAIITTAVLRFNTYGQLSAICTGPTKYVASGPDIVDNSRTFETDAAVILGLWIAQMVFCCSNCCHMAFSGKPVEATNE